MPVLCGSDSIYCGNAIPEITIFASAIKSVVLSPNPVNQNAALAVTVDVIEIDVAVASAKIFYIGTLSCNQETI